MWFKINKKKSDELFVDANAENYAKCLNCEENLFTRRSTEHKKLDPPEFLMIDGLQSRFGTFMSRDNIFELIVAQKVIEPLFSRRK